MVGIASSAADEARFFFFCESSACLWFLYFLFLVKEWYQSFCLSKRSSGCSDSSEGENPFYLAFLYGKGFSKNEATDQMREAIGIDWAFSHHFVISEAKGYSCHFDWGEGLILVECLNDHQKCHEVKV